MSVLMLNVTISFTPTVRYTAAYSPGDLLVMEEAEFLLHVSNRRACPNHRITLSNNAPTVKLVFRK